ncbi:helix-turn-helix domain-containing protein [Thermaerobacillus caldiproteolyticus]|uniref:helix-turn-helix domain-containing protein n=1 Tax=Thermaerobacillus caldiproteolyticus TaxID=247480 RepID=UPI0018F22DB1|nr:helix-turn-helix transcriptional regulator [Anoxybacillus caldiproteolyticus]
MEKSRIRSIRRQKDISGTKVAEMLGISAQYYYDIEKGKRNLSAEMAARLAEIFGVTTDYLLGRTDELSPNKTADWDSKLPELTEKEERDIALTLEKILNELDHENAVSFYGEPMDEETREAMRISLESSLRLAKQLAKKKFTPKKYRK